MVMDEGEKVEGRSLDRADARVRTPSTSVRTSRRRTWRDFDDAEDAPPREPAAATSLSRAPTRPVPERGETQKSVRRPANETADLDRRPELELELDEVELENARPVRRWVVATSFGVAALAIVVISIFVNRPEEPLISPQVAGLIEVADTESTTAAPAPVTIIPEAVTSATTTEVPEIQTTAAPTSTTGAVSEEAEANIDLPAIAAVLGELTLTTYSEQSPVSGNSYSFAIRIENDSIVEVPISVISIDVLIGNDRIDDVAFLTEHSAIPAGDSATGTVRIDLPRTAEGPVIVEVRVSDVVLGSATVG